MKSYHFFKVLFPLDIGLISQGKGQILTMKLIFFLLSAKYLFNYLYSRPYPCGRLPRLLLNLPTYYGVFHLKRNFLLLQNGVFQCHLHILIFLGLILCFFLLFSLLYKDRNQRRWSLSEYNYYMVYIIVKYIFTSRLVRHRLL